MATAGGPPSARTGPPLRRPQALVLTAILVVFAALGTVIAVKTPAYESGDEPGHVQNVETLVSGHWYGMDSNCRGTLAHSVNCSGDEAHQAPLYYLALAAWQRSVGVAVHSVQPGPIDYLSTRRGVFVHHGSNSFLLVLRLPNVLLGLLTVVVALLLGREVSQDPWTPVVAAAVVAFFPRFIFLTSFVTNDNLAILFGALLTLVSVRFVRGPTAWRMAAVGAVFGLLVITKLSALPLGLVIVVVVCLARKLKYLVIGVGAAALVSGWYLVQNTVRYGDPLARTASARYLAQVGGLGLPIGQPYVVHDPLGLVFRAVPLSIARSFWYESGWGQFRWPWPVNLLFWLALAFALVGLAHRNIDGAILITLGATAIVSLLTVWGVAFQTSTFPARFALVGLAAIAGLTALGLERWRPPVRFLLPVAGLVGIGVAIQQNVVGVHWT